MIDGPRIAPRSGTAKQLVVFLHGYGADGNDLISLGREWQASSAGCRVRFAECAGAGAGSIRSGRQWFGLTFRDPDERWRGVNKAQPVLERISRRGTRRNTTCRLRPLALVGFSQGTMMALHTGLRRSGACGDRRLFGRAGDALRIRKSTARRRRRKSKSGRRCCSCMAIRTR
jgi:phospholipase/carboxylesterase